MANQLNLLQNEMTAAAECESVKNCQVNSRIAVRVRRRHNRRLRPSYKVMKRGREETLRKIGIKAETEDTIRLVGSACFLI